MAPPVTPMDSSVLLTARTLFRYPVKACGPERVDSLEFDSEGLVVGDREWVVVDQDSIVVWQGSHPRLALIRPSLDNGTLILLNDADEQLIVEANDGTEPDEVRIWNDIAKCHDIYCGKDAGDEAARFLQQTAGPGLRLVRLERAALRRAGVNTVHLATEESFSEFLTALAPAQRHLGSALRFRPNVLVQGLDEPLVPFVEEHLRRLDWSSNGFDCSLALTGLCIRCIVPNVDPATGQIDTTVLDTVSKLSAERHPAQPTYFGVYARPAGQGTLTRGDVMTGTLSF